MQRHTIQPMTMAVVIGTTRPGADARPPIPPASRPPVPARAIDFLGFLAARAARAAFAPTFHLFRLSRPPIPSFFHKRESSRPCRPAARNPAISGSYKPPLVARRLPVAARRSVQPAPQRCAAFNQGEPFGHPKALARIASGEAGPKFHSVDPFWMQRHWKTRGRKPPAYIQGQEGPAPQRPGRAATAPQIRPHPSLVRATCDLRKGGAGAMPGR